MWLKNPVARICFIMGILRDLWHFSVPDVINLKWEANSDITSFETSA